MYKPESFGGSKEVNVEKSTELSRARSQAFGNKTLKAAELYKRREELLKKKAELEAKLRAAGVDPEEIASQTRAEFYAKHKAPVNSSNKHVEHRPPRTESDSQKINVRLVSREVPPKIVAEKTRKNRGIKRLITSAVIAGLTAIISTTALSGSALKKNQKNIPKVNPTAVEATANIDVNDSSQDSTIPAVYEAITEFNLGSGSQDVAEAKVIERTDNEKPSAEPVNIDSVITNPAEISVDAQIVDAQPVDVQLLDTQVVDTVVPQESQISSEQSAEQDSEEETEEHHHHHHKKNKNKDKDNIDFEDEDDEDNEDDEDQEDENEEENESNENANPGLIDPDRPMAPPPMIEEPTPIAPEPDDTDTTDEEGDTEEDENEENEADDWDDDWGDDLNDESEEENEEGAEDEGDTEDVLDYEIIEEPEMLEPLAPPESESIPEEPAPEPAPEPLVIEPIIEEPEAISEPEPEPEPAPSAWGGAVLNSSNGRINGPSGEETYYNLKMNRVVENMHNMGFEGDYWVRDDGVKMFGNYVMVAADLNVHPRGSLVETSLGTGIVCDTGDFAKTNPTQLDIATSW